MNAVASVLVVLAVAYAAAALTIHAARNTRGNRNV